MRRQTLVLVGVVSLVVAAATGCSKDAVVGVLLPTSGELADYGESVESGVRLAISDAREQGLLPPGFEVVWADSASQPSRAVEELNRLVKDRQPRIKLLIGGVTNAEADALLPLLDEFNLICLSPSAQAVHLTHESRLFYRLFPNDHLEGVKAAGFVADKFGNEQTGEKVMLYVGEPAYAEGLEKEFVDQYVNNANGEILERIDLNEAGWQEASSAALRAHRPRVVYIIDFAHGIVDVLEHLKSQRFEGSLVTTSAIFNQTAIDAAGDLTEMVMFPLPAYDLTSEKAVAIREFARRYMDTYQRVPDIYAAHGYDAMRVAMEAFKAAGIPETSELKKAFQFGISEYMGVTGVIQFDDRGDVKHNPIMYLIKDGSVISYSDYIRIVLEDMRKGRTGRSAPAQTPRR